MNGVGFVISEKHQKIITAERVAEWRQRFSDIPDLEAALSTLALNLLQRGPMHKGWDYPEAWMVKPLSDMNQEAADKRKIADAKIAGAQRGQPTKTFKR